MSEQEQSPWADIVGPCYFAPRLARELHLTAAEVQQASAALDILSLRTADGTYLYPAFQVREGALTPGLRPVLETLKGGIDDPWTWAQWLTAKADENPSPLEELWSGRLAAVLRDARHDAWAWSN